MQFLFPTPFWHIPKTEDHPEDSLSWALSMQKEIGVQKSNRGGGYQSHSNHSFEYFPYLEYMQKKLIFLPKFTFKNWWVNINEKGSYNVAHTHPDCDLSVVWYLTDNHHSPINFFNPYANTRYHLNNCLGIDNEYQFKCNSGDILVFPGDLMHYVESNPLDQSRVSIAFNLSLL